MPTVTTNEFRYQEGGGNVNLSADTWVVSLMNNHVNSATADTLKDYNLWSEVSAYEASGTNYTSGSILTSVILSANDTSNKAYMDAADVTFSNVSISSYGCCIWRSSDGLLMGFIDFGEVVTSLNSNLNITWNNDGILNKI